jgi:hypothetical protein
MAPHGRHHGCPGTGCQGDGGYSNPFLRPERPRWEGLSRQERPPGGLRHPGIQTAGPSGLFAIDLNCGSVPGTDWNPSRGMAVPAMACRAGMQLSRTQSETQDANGLYLPSFSQEIRPFHWLGLFSCRKIESTPPQLKEHRKGVYEGLSTTILEWP